MPGGRPTKYKKEYAEQAAKLCLLSATDKQLANFFNVTESTIAEWKNKHPKFSESLKLAKAQKDKEVERSLYDRAMGYVHKETKVFCQNGEIIKEDIEKHYPPDSTSMIFWLKNRQPEKWRDKQEIEISDRPKVMLTKKRFDGGE